MVEERFTLDIGLGNAALRSDAEGDEIKSEPNPQAVAELLRQAAQKIERSDSLSGSLRDYNGNTVGSFAVEEVF